MALIRQSSRTVVGSVLLLVIVASITVTVWKVLTVSSEIGSAFLFGTASVIASILTYIFAKRADRERLIEEEHRKQKIPIYEEFMLFAFRNFFSKSNGTEKQSSEEVAEYLTNFTRQIMVWGSDTVVMSYSAFRRQSATFIEHSNPRDQIDMMLTFEELLYCLRQDIGHANKNMKQGDLLRLFINDFDTFIDQNGVTLRKRRPTR